MVRMLCRVSGTWPDTAATARRLSSCAAVVQLRGQHTLLHVEGEQGKQRQHQQQYQRKAGVFHCDDGHDGEDAAGVRRHADDAGGEQSFHGVHIAGKAGGHLTGVLLRQGAGGQPRQLLRHLGAQRVGHFLPEEHQKALLGGGKQTLQGETAEVEQRREQGQRGTAGQTVDDAAQQQRRYQRCGHRRRHTQERARREQAAGGRRRADGGEHAAFMPGFHACSPPA